MSGRGASAAAAFPQYERRSNEDYAAYVSRIEKTTSMVEGPHFPNLQAVRKQKEELERQEELRSRVGRFGTVVHLERRIDNKTSSSSSAYY